MLIFHRSVAMKVLVILLGLVALVSAQGDNCCSSGDVEQLLRDWESVWGAQFSGRRTAIGRAVFDK